MKYILKKSTWRSGVNSLTSTGKGNTYLLNDEGFMCCLGQFCIQEGVEPEIILNKALPIMIKDKLPEESLLCNPRFESEAVNINDCEFAGKPVEQRIYALRKLIEFFGHTLEVIE